MHSVVPFLSFHSQVCYLCYIYLYCVSIPGKNDRIRLCTVVVVWEISGLLHSNLTCRSKLNDELPGSGQLVPAHHASLGRIQTCEWASAVTSWTGQKWVRVEGQQPPQWSLCCPPSTERCAASILSHVDSSCFPWLLHSILKYSYPYTSLFYK